MAVEWSGATWWAAVPVARRPAAAATIVASSCVVRQPCAASSSRTSSSTTLLRAQRQLQRQVVWGRRSAQQQQRVLRRPLAAGDGEPAEEDDDAGADAFWKDFTEGMGAAGLVTPPPGAEEELDGIDVAEVIGMGSWRLAGKVVPAIGALVAHVEQGWREILPDLSLYPLDKKWKYLDSLDPEHKVPMSYMQLRDPRRDEPAWPRLQLENRAYRSRAFRKLHIEVAVQQNGLQVFHCVMYPRLEYDLPILSMDVVANAETGAVSLAIADPCPVSANLALPSFYEAPIRELQERYGVANSREIPEWGRAIFSPLCVIMRPQSGEELGAFLKYAIALARYHTQVGDMIRPVGDAGRQRRLQEIHAAHERYVAMQLRNDKTRRVLEKGFSPALADAYLRTVMFDVEPLAPGGPGSSGGSPGGNGLAH